MRIRDYAKKKGVHYRTAYHWYKDGKMRGYQMDTGTIIITERAKRKTERITQGLMRDDHATG